ncbi:MAG: hypothetical protein GX591_11665 [Planctomycetes bacterium]|nr:hypothetical protein [Planctomycetota bacterium]
MVDTARTLWVTAAALAALSLAADVALPPGVAGGVPYIVIVLLSLWSPRERMTIVAAVAGTVLIFAGIFLPPPGDLAWEVVVNRSLATFALWVTAVLILVRRAADRRRVEAMRQREQALADAKVLRGLLPICAGCKKIRDDSGYWSTLETYIRTHSEADFSHGLCPDCIRRLYPDYEPQADDPDDPAAPEPKDR